MNDKNQKFPKGVEVVGGAIIENDQGEILLTRSSKWHGKYVFPGGHIEPGESIAGALLREAREEVGLKLKFISIVASGELINSKDFYRPAHFIYFDIYCRALNNEIKLDQTELQDYVWVVPEQALKLDLAESIDDSVIKFIEYKKHNR